MTARKTNMAASVRQRLLNRAREQREDFGLLLTRFGTERLFYRLGAVERTFERRRTTVPADVPLPLTAEFHDDPGKAMQWRAFLGRNCLDGEVTTLETVVGVIEGFLMPVCLAVRAGGRFEAIWPMGGPWRR